MLREYKLANGRTYRFEEGEQPQGAALVEKSAAEKQTPETRAAKAATRRRKAAPAKGE